MRHQLIKIAVATMFSVACLNGYATTQNSSGKYTWSFLSGKPWPQGYSQNTGKPDGMQFSKSEYSADFFKRITSALPEAKVNEAFLTDDVGSNITLKEAGDVYVTFIHEGAGYQNSFGYFLFDKNNPPKSKSEIKEIIVFPNLSYPHMASGHRIRLGSFPAGTSIGFFLAANGFSYYTGVSDANIPHYYSLKSLNPDPTDKLRQHNVLLADSSTAEVVMGFEDLPRAWGDNDFNDAVFSVKVTPETAIDTSTLAKMPAVNDSDADGIPDTLDEFPRDYTRASSSYYPSKTDSVTLAFEDNWPEVGDYDMNDLVVSERLRTIYNAAGKVSGFQLEGSINARGANFHNGFGLRVMNQLRSIVASSTLTIAGKTVDKTTENNQNNPVFILWSDTHSYTTTGATGSCAYFNVVSTCPASPVVPFTLDVKLQTPISALNHSELDFFIFRTDYRGREVHFANYAPTDVFDKTQFGKFDDTSNISQGRYFRTAKNLPWALKIPGAWRHPREYIDVLWAFPEYEAWVESSGSKSTDWYLKSKGRSTHYY